MKRPFPVKSFTLFLVVGSMSAVFIAWTNARYPDHAPSERQQDREWMERHTRAERTENYEKNIKPHFRTP